MPAKYFNNDNQTQWKKAISISRMDPQNDDHFEWALIGKWSYDMQSLTNFSPSINGFKFNFFSFFYVRYNFSTGWSGRAMNFLAKNDRIIRDNYGNEGGSIEDELLLFSNSRHDWFIKFKLLARNMLSFHVFTNGHESWDNVSAPTTF